MTNDAHSLGGDGHSPRQRPAPDLRRSPPCLALETQPELSTHVGAPIEAPNRAGTGWRKISDAMDCRATNLYTASFPGKAGFSRRHDGLRDRIYREAVRAGLLAHREYAPAVMRGLTNEQRKALDAASAAALHCEAGGAEPPQDAVRVVDNVRTIRPDLLLHSREPGGMRMLIEVKSIAFGMSRYSTRWHLDGATWTERRAAEAVKERDAAAAAIDTEVFAGVVPPPMQTQVQRMGGMSSAVIGGFCEHSPVVHELVAKFADMTAKDTAKEHGWQLKEATAYQRHRIRQRLATGAWRDFHENKIARLPYVDPSTEYARTLRHLQASDARWRAEKNRAQSYTLGTQGVGGSAGGHRPFGGVPPPPQPRLRGSGGDAPT